jgi:hypothetical protein
MPRFQSLGSFVGLFVFTAPALAQAPIFTPAQRAEGEAQIQVAAKAIAKTVRDPSAVIFRNVYIQKRIMPGREPVTLCGEVNGRNAFGGLSGFRAFTLVGDEVYVGTAVGFAVEELCSNNSPIIDTRDYTPEVTAAYKAADGI